MDEERLLSYHCFTREHGVNRPLYFLARLILVPFFQRWILLYFFLDPLLQISNGYLQQLHELNLLRGKFL